MKSPILNFLTILYLFLQAGFSTLFASQIEIKDTILSNSIWTADTVKITGDLFLPQNYSLIIAPGTRVEFQGYYSFQFRGTITAVGVPNDSIVFSINDTTGFYDLSNTMGGWKNFQGGGNTYPSSVFKYCVFEYAKNLSGDYAISIGNPKQYYIEFCYNLVQHNYAIKSALYVGRGGINYSIIRNNLCNAVSTGSVSNSLILENNGNGLVLNYRMRDNEDDWTGSISSSNSFEKNNGYAIKIDSNITCNVSGNTIKENLGGIYSVRGSAKIINNSISYNHTYGAINVNSTSVKIIGNLVYNNSILTFDTLNKFAAGIHIINSEAIGIYNNTFVNNQGVNCGGISLINFKNANIYNNILWNNNVDEKHKEAIFFTDQPSIAHKLSLHSNLIKNGVHAITFSPEIEVDSTVLISADPHFTDFTGYDYSITLNSRCINMGKNLPPINMLDFPSYDIAGKYRVMCNILDIGAYEFEPDSIFIANLINNDTTVYCEKFYTSIYLRSNIYWNPFDPHGFIYQWQKDGINIDGAIKEDLLIENVPETAFGKYSIIVGGYMMGPKTFNYTIINTLATLNTETIAVSDGSDTTIRLKNIVNESADFQWYKNRTSYGGNFPYLEFINIQPDDEGYYYCVISNDCATTPTDSVYLNFLTYCELQSPIDTVLSITACSGLNFYGHYLTKTGTYYDTLPSFNGCDSIITLNLTIPVLDTTVIISNSGLSASMPELEYQWIDCNNNNSPISGETGQTFVPSGSGNYAVIVMKDGCSDTSTCNSFILTGLNNPISDENLIIYPNPFKASATIALRDQKTEIDEIRLVNMIGEVVFNKNYIQNNTFLLERAGLKPGNYIVVIMTSTNVYRQSIIIK